MKLAQLTLDGRVVIIGEPWECLACLEPGCEGCGSYHQGRFTSPTLERLQAAIGTSPSEMCRECGKPLPPE